MNRLLNSGTFWLKCLFFSLLASLLLYIGLYASAYHLFTPRRIHDFAQAGLEGTGRRIRFDTVSGRRWFPRPTVTLKNLTVTRPGSSQAAIFIKETEIGLGWQTFWSDHPVIEKWLVEGAQATIERTADGHWSLQDLWQQQSRTTVNRLRITGSDLRLRLIQGEYPIEHFELDAEAADADGRRFTVSGTLNHPSAPLDWQGSGVLKTAKGNWLVPSFRLNAQGRLNGETLDIRGDSALEWRPRNSTLLARDTTLRADSSYRSLHLTSRAPLLTLNTDRLNIKTLNSVFTADAAEGQWNGTLELDQTQLRPDTAELAGFTFNASRQSGAQQTDFSASGPLRWQRNSGLKSEALHIATLQNPSQTGRRPRFASQLEGSFEMSAPNRWQGRFQGFFDRQRTALSVKYAAENGQTPLLEAGIALQKLAIEPYWADVQAQSGNLYPAFLSLEWFPKIEAHIQIGSMTLPGMQLDDVETLASADSSHIALTNFKAGLYGGRTEGGISMANTTPVSYHLQQNARGVQIRPLLQDLFGFHNFSGTGDAVLDLTAKGQNRKSLLQFLEGSLSLNVSDGAWHGIDLDGLMRNGTSAQSTAQAPQTPFQHFTLNSIIEKGISRHADTELSSGRLRVVSNGYTDLNTQTLSEELLIYNRLNPLSKPVPLKIKGAIGNPSVTLDYRRLTDGLDTPQQKQKALEETLREQWQWLIPKPK